MTSLHLYPQMCNYCCMAKDKPKPTRESDQAKLDRNAKKPKADDRILGLGKLIGRKPPKK